MQDQCFSSYIITDVVTMKSDYVTGSVVSMLLGHWAIFHTIYFLHFQVSIKDSVFTANIEAQSFEGA